MTKGYSLALTPAVQWHEGMMLSPQHFQQSDLRHHQVLSHQMMLSSYYHWGVYTLKLDPIVLPDGLVRVLELEALLPDTLIVHYSANMTDIPPLEIDIKPLRTDEPKQEIIIHLAVPEYLEESSPVIGEFPRYYSIEGQETKDINVDDSVIRVPRLYPKIFLHAGDQPPARCHSFPMLKMTFSEGTFVRTDYLHPCFFVEKNTLLWESVAEVVQKMREKATYLSEKWQNQIGTPMLQETTAILKPLISALPGLETIVHGDPIHPYKLYIRLCDLVGDLATLRLSQIPPVLPTYQHNDLNACFGPVLAMAKQYLNSIDLSFASFSFQQKERLFYLRMHPDYLQDKLYIGVRAPVGMTEVQLEEWMNDSIICSDFAVETVRARRITGNERTMLQNEDLYDLMPSRGVVIFQLTPDPEYIKPDQNLNIFNPADHSDRRPTEIVLYVRKVEAK